MAFSNFRSPREYEFATDTLEAGALGYVIKTRIVSDLLVAINEVHAGRTFVSPLSPPQAII